MDARTRLTRFCAMSALTVFAILVTDLTAATVRSRNFVVTASSDAYARQVCRTAENQRRELAKEWLGRELPPWRDPCPIEVRDLPGAGGVTSFYFDNGVPYGWKMAVQGSRERVLDSVLPHEITHTIFATHFGQRLPRWADEGACTTVEHVSERKKQDNLLVHCLSNRRGIPFSRMFRMMEYPDDMLAIYAQGYSVSRFLIAQGGKRTYVKFVGEGLKSQDWNAAVRNHYGYKNLSELQITWNEWVRKGSPDLPQNARLASARRAVKASEEADKASTVQVENKSVRTKVGKAAGVRVIPPSPLGSVAPLTGDGRAVTAPTKFTSTQGATGNGGGWYASRARNGGSAPAKAAPKKPAARTAIHSTNVPYRPGSTGTIHR